MFVPGAFGQTGVDSSWEIIGFHFGQVYQTKMSRRERGKGGGEGEYTRGFGY